MGSGPDHILLSKSAAADLLESEKLVYFPPFGHLAPTAMRGLRPSRPDRGETDLRKQLSWLAIAGALSFVVTSCTGSPQTPISPSAAVGGTTSARSDPATLKV